MHEVKGGRFAKGKLQSEFESKHDPDVEIVECMDRLAEQELNQPECNGEKAEDTSLQANANKEVPDKWKKLSAATMDILSDDSTTEVDKAKHTVQDLIGSGNNKIRNHCLAA